MLSCGLSVTDDDIVLIWLYLAQLEASSQEETGSQSSAKRPQVCPAWF